MLRRERRDHYLMLHFTTPEEMIQLWSMHHHHHHNRKTDHRSEREWQRGNERMCSYVMQSLPPLRFRCVRVMKFGKWRSCIYSHCFSCSFFLTINKDGLGMPEKTNLPRIFIIYVFNLPTHQHSPTQNRNRSPQKEGMKIVF